MAGCWVSTVEFLASLVVESLRHPEIYIYIYLLKYGDLDNPFHNLTKSLTQKSFCAGIPKNAQKEHFK